MGFYQNQNFWLFEKTLPRKQGKPLNGKEYSQYMQTKKNYI